jgi:hypothetical protein
MRRITTFCICIHVFGCRLSLFKLCDSDFGIIPVAYIAIGTTCTASCFHIARISFASSWYFFCFLLLFWRDLCSWNSCVYQEGIFCFLVRERYAKSVGRYCFVRNNAAIPVQFEVVILQHVCWFVPIVWAFVFS